MDSRFSKLTCMALTLACVVLMPIAVAAQDAAKPAKAPVTDSPSKWDIFAGYSYLAPKSSEQIAGDYPRSINAGAIGSVTRYFNNYVGFQLEGDYHDMHNENVPNNDFSGGSGGIIFRFPSEDITPFIHALVGGETAGSYYYDNQWGVVLTAGGGVDYNTPLIESSSRDSRFPGGLPVHTRKLLSGGPRKLQHGPPERRPCFQGGHDCATSSDNIGLLGKPDFGVPRRAGHGDGNSRNAESEGKRHL